MKTLLSLRDFQQQAIDSTEEWLAEDVTHQRPAIVLPTGAGKTVTFSHAIKRYLDANPGKRVVVLVDRDELVRQTVRALHGVAPHLITGVVKAKENDVHADVVVASVQTLKNPGRLAQVKNVGRVIVDECDLASAPSYITILTAFGCFDPKSGVDCWGFTATLYRSDGRTGAVWQNVTFSRDISWMIRRRYLIPPRGKAVEVPNLNLRDVASTRQDFKEAELGQALADSLAPETVAKAILEHASDRKVLAFFPTVASAYVFAEAIEAAGMPAEVIHGGMSQQERDDVKARHKRGTVLVNCMILTVGYDDPEVDCIVMGRPTKSKRLYVQIVGRGLRVDPSRPYDEQECLLLSVVGDTGMDLRSIVDLSDKPLDPKKSEGRTLTELEDDFDAGEGVEQDTPNYHVGDVNVRDFDPLGRVDTSRVWLKTRGGTFFVPAGKRAYVFIMEYPRPGAWSVGWCTTDPYKGLMWNDLGVGQGGLDGRDELLKSIRLDDGKRKTVALTIHGDLPLEEAMEWAHDIAQDMGAGSLNTASRKAPWRKKPPTEKLKDYARSLGIDIADRMAGVISDDITTVAGSRRIDPLVQKVTGK